MRGRSSGLGQATVLYWLGIALAKVGPDHMDDARNAFAQAAQTAGGRLLHNDGPWLEPRARARLTALGASSQ